MRILRCTGVIFNKHNTGLSKINRAKFSDTCSVGAKWLCMGWPFYLAEMRREFQTGGNFFGTMLYTRFRRRRKDNMLKGRD